MTATSARNATTDHVGFCAVFSDGCAVLIGVVIMHTAPGWRPAWVAVASNCNPNQVTLTGHAKHMHAFHGDTAVLTQALEMSSTRRLFKLAVSVDRGLMPGVHASSLLASS